MNFYKILLAFCVLFAFSQQGLATHNRAGQITYEHVSGNTYRITILTCTDISSPNNADRQFMPIDWGDFSPLDSIERTGNGTVVIPFVAKENRYVKVHTYPGPGTYILYTEDPNRNAGVNNIPNSVDVIFSVSSILVISPNINFGTFNNSVQLLIPPKDDACRDALWVHNPGAVDPDGDSLSYELIPCTAANGQPIIGYVFPNDFPTVGGTGNGVLSIDAFSGTVTWANPMFPGLYNIAIRINEYRQGIFVGAVIRDMQVTVYNCVNQPPEIQPLQDMCIVVGSTGSQAITAIDPNDDSMNMEMFGESFQGSPPSTFTQTNTFNPAMGTFLWSPSCAQVQSSSYTAFVKVTDINADIDLSDIDFFNISVVSPAVENLMTTVQQGGDILLEWDAGLCTQASGYKVYRRLGSSSYTPGPCVTGLPASAGYTLIATVENNDLLEYLDTDVPYGSDVCYRVVACFTDGAQSIVSDEVCDRIERVKPAITQATVDVTSQNAGQVTLRWAAPLDLDTLGIFTGPYAYQVYRADGDGNFTLVGSTSETSILNVPLDDLFLIDGNLNTENVQYEYRVELLNNGLPVSISTSASTVFMTLTPLDNRVLISWEEDVPWINETYDVFQVDQVTGIQTYLITVSEQSYEHLGLTNGTEYCFAVQSHGNYAASSGILVDIDNYSQTDCTRPIDLEPPCPPFLDFTGSCENEDYELTWIVYEQPCNEDVTAFNIYYAENDTAEYELLLQIMDPSALNFALDEAYGVGCFVVTALDSLLIQPDGSITQNESDFSERICLESCPHYELPNVISPNGDGMNDFFMPFMPYRYVDLIDLQIFNRWGQLVFESHDPDIQWKGDHKDSGDQVSDGVYYYTVTIYERRLQGIVPRNVAGYIQVLDNKGFITE